MAKTKSSNHTKPTKRRVRLTGKAVARSRAGATITVTRRNTRLTGRASAKSRAWGTLTVTTRGEREDLCAPGPSDKGEISLTTDKEPASHRRRLSIRGPDAPPGTSGTLTELEDRRRACTGDDNGGKHRVITLTQGKFTIVDADDYERLSEHKWYAAKTKGGRFYAARNVVRSAGRRMVLMHREIMNPPPGMVCDHKNHNTLDNRKSNLRICTPAQNAYNQLPKANGTSRYKGVHWRKDHQKWQASIFHDGRRIHIGYYDYEADAAIAYDDMAIDLFGEFACLNFDHRPEIRLWMEATYLFCPTRNELVSMSC